MHVAVSIVGYRNADDIVRCLKALERSVYTDFEVIVCENGGADAYAELTKALPGVLARGQKVRAVDASTNVGYSGGVNRCLRETPDADAWWVLNPDTEPHVEAMGLQVARLQQGDCDAVGCTLHLPNGVIQSYGGRWSSWFARAESMGHGKPIGTSVEPALVEARQSYLNGASMMVTRRFVESAGYMREDYFLYCEEVEWCLRAVTQGMKLGFAPGAYVLHHQGTSTGNSRDIREKTRAPVYLNERNKLNLTRDRFPFRFPVAALAVFGVLFLRYGRRRAWRQLGYGLAGWSAGLRNERGVPAWMN